MKNPSSDYELGGFDSFADYNEWMWHEVLGLDADGNELPCEPRTLPIDFEIPFN